MDKYQYKISLQEIGRLIDERRFEEAAGIADTIDWGRVKSTETLCRIGDLYKINREYEKSRRLMSLANARDPENTDIIYSLAELTIFLYGKGELQADLASAIRLNQIYQEAQPTNPKRLILQYKLFDAMHASAQERASVLRSLKEESYTARWGYELAKVLHEAGMDEEAASECRSVSTRFDGKFADKASQLLKTLNQDDVVAGAQSDVTETAEEIIRKSMQETAADAYAKEHEAELVRRETEQEEASRQTGGNLYQFRQGTHPVPHRATRIRIEEESKENTGAGEKAPEGDDAAKEASSNHENINADAVNSRAAGENAGNEAPLGVNSAAAAYRAAISGDAANADENTNNAANGGDVADANAANAADVAGAAKEPARQVEFPTAGSNTSRMSIGQVMDEWEKIRRDMRRANDQKRAQKILTDTGNLMQEFDEIAKHGLIEDIEKGVAKQQRTARVFGREDRRQDYREPAYEEEQYGEAQYDEQPYDNQYDERYEENQYADDHYNDDQYADRYEEDGYEDAAQGDVVTDDVNTDANEAIDRTADRDSRESHRASDHSDRNDADVADADVADAADENVADETDDEAQSQETSANYGSTDIAVQFDAPKEQYDDEVDEDGYHATRRWNARAVRRVMEAEKARMAALEAAEEDKLQRAVDAARESESEELYKALKAGETSALRRHEVAAAVEKAQKAVSESEEVENSASEENDATESNVNVAKTAANAAKKPTYDETETEAIYDEAETESFDETEAETSYEEAETEVADAYDEADVVADEDFVEVEETEDGDYEASEESESTEDYEEGTSESEEESADEDYREDDENDADHGDDTVYAEDEEEGIPSRAERAAKARQQRRGRPRRQESPAKRRGNAPTERVLSEEERRLFGPICVVRENCQQILQAIEKISLASYTGNLIISGSEGAARKVAQGLLEITKRGDGNFTGRIARANASGLNRLNRQKLSSTLQQIENGALIVEEATGLKRDALQNLRDELEGKERGLIVILIDNRKAVESFVKENEKYLNSFDIRIDIKALNDKALVSYGIEYAMARDYSIDEFGRLALSSRISSMQTRDHHVSTKEVRDIVDEAISYASKKSLRTLIEIITRKRYDQDDRIIIHEKDFTHY